MEKSLTKKPVEKLLPLTHQTNIHIWVVHYIVQQSALNAMEKKPNSAVKPQILFILNNSFLKGKWQNGRTLICTEQK
jgi:hypothetical protein